MDREDAVYLNEGDLVWIRFPWYTDDDPARKGEVLSVDRRSMTVVYYDIRFTEDNAEMVSNLINRRDKWELYGGPVLVEKRNPREFDTVMVEMGGHADWVRALLGYSR